MNFPNISYFNQPVEIINCRIFLDGGILLFSYFRKGGKNMTGTFLDRRILNKLLDLSDSLLRANQCYYF